MKKMHLGSPVCLVSGLVIFFMSSQVQSSEVGKHGDWLPAKPGIRKYYRVETQYERKKNGKVVASGNEITSEIRGITAVVQKDGTPAFRRRVFSFWNDGAEVSSTKWWTESEFVVQDDGIFRTRRQYVGNTDEMDVTEFPLEGKELYLKNPLKIGDRWKHEYVSLNSDYHEDTWAEVIGTDDLKTPHGLYKDCLVIQISGPIRDRTFINGKKVVKEVGTYSETRWLASGVGKVKRVIESRTKWRGKKGAKRQSFSRTTYLLYGVRTEPPELANAERLLKEKGVPLFEDANLVLDLLLDQDFSALAKRFSEYKERDRAHGPEASSRIEALIVFSKSNESLRKPLDAWVKDQPDSVDARMARGIHLYASASASRGSDTAANTDGIRMKRMTDYLAGALQDFYFVVNREPEFPNGHLYLIRALGLAGLKKEMWKAFEYAISIDPSDRAYYDGLLSWAEPRWGGPGKRWTRSQNWPSPRIPRMKV